MTAYVDNFTGTVGQKLTTYNPLWKVHPQGISDHPQWNVATISNAFRVRAEPQSVADTYYWNDTVLDSSNYDIIMDTVIDTHSNGISCALLARVVPSFFPTPDNTLYVFEFKKPTSTTATVTLTRILSGTQTIIASSGSFVTTGTGTWQLKFELRNSTLNCYINDVLRATATDTAITAAGRAGLRVDNFSTDTRGNNLDNFTVNTVILNRIITPTGGVTFSGTGSIVTFSDPSHVIPTTGGVVFGGTGNQSNLSAPPHVITPSGGIVFSGTGDILFEKSPPHIIPVSGGIVFSGNAPMLFNYEPPVGGPRMPLTGVGL